MFNRASSKSSEHLPRIAQLVVPEAATDAAAGASAAEGVVAPNVLQSSKIPKIKISEDGLFREIEESHCQSWDGEKKWTQRFNQGKWGDGSSLIA